MVNFVGSDRSTNKHVYCIKGTEACMDHADSNELEKRYSIARCATYLII